MSTTEAQVMYLGVKIAELKTRLYAVEQRASNAIHERTRAEAERDAAALERDALADQVEKLERCMKQYTKLEGSRLAAYEDLAEDVDAVERCVKQLAKVEGSRLTAYEDLDDKAIALAERVTAARFIVWDCVSCVGT